MFDCRLVHFGEAMPEVCPFHTRCSSGQDLNRSHDTFIATVARKRLRDERSS
jgi:hypothetical protein